MVPKKVDVKKLKELWEKGLKPTEIASKLGVTERTVYRYIAQFESKDEDILIADIPAEPPKPKKKEKEKKEKKPKSDNKEERRETIWELIIQL